MAKSSTILAVLFSFEICLAVAAMVLFVLKFPEASRRHDRHGSSTCSETSCGRHTISRGPSATESESLTMHPGLAIATLSLLVVCLRAILSRLGYLSQTVTAMYDVLLCFLWSLSVISQCRPVTEQYRAIGCGDDAWCTAVGACFFISTIAAATYAARLACHVTNWIQERNREKRRKSLLSWLSFEEEEGQLDVEHSKQVFKEALSPVLAFFPESTTLLPGRQDFVTHTSRRLDSYGSHV